MTTSPGARVGRVAHVRPDDMLAAVGGLSAAEVKPGATISFEDANQNVVANGTVFDLQKSSDYVVVEFTPAPGGRAPRSATRPSTCRPTPVRGDVVPADVSPPPPRLILASASPRRRDLLTAAGYVFDVFPADVDESDYPPGTLPADLAERLANAKAAAVALRFPADVILAADTVVAFGDLPLGKPADAADAVRMLKLLAGTTHVVVTGVAVVHAAAGFDQSARVLSAVRMRPLTPVEVARYVRTGDWQGKAGGYGIQDDRPDPFVTRLSGSHTNIVGLPMERTAELLAGAGVRPAALPESRLV